MVDSEPRPDVQRLLQGLYNAQFLQLLALGVIPLVFAIWLGNKIHDMINQKMFNRLTYCLLLAAGSMILI